MRKLKFSPRTLRLSTKIIASVILLLVVSMALIFRQSSQTLQREAVESAEETLEATTLKVENILRSVEQTTGNIYYDMILHLSDLSRMPTYTREMVKSNPYIYGCAIAYNANLLDNSDRLLFYTHRKSYNSSELVTSDRYSDKPYMDQAWYVDPAKLGQIFWMVPKTDRRNDDVPVMLYCIPIRYATSDQTMCVIAVEVSMDLFSQVVQEAKPSTNSYCMLLDNDGTYIIHPDHNKLNGQTVYTAIEEDADTTMLSTANAMLSGESGYKSFRAQGKDYYAFYKPFHRVDGKGHNLYNINWTISLIYPKEDITASFKGMFIHALTVSAGALLVFFMLCRIVLRRQLKPLRKVAEAAEEIAEGNFGEEIPKSRRQDEVGDFLKHFKRMRDALFAKLTEQEQLTAALQQRRDTLRETYEEIQEYNDVKEDLLHNVSDKMIAPAQAISRSINAFCDDYQNISLQEATHEVDNIREQRETILEALNQILPPPENEMRKEDSYE